MELVWGKGDCRGKRGEGGAPFITRCKRTGIKGSVNIDPGFRSCYMAKFYFKHFHLNVSPPVCPLNSTLLPPPSFGELSPRSTLRGILLPNGKAKFLPSTVEMHVGCGLVGTNIDPVRDQQSTPVGSTQPRVPSCASCF
ncbi:hypothetical protein Pcinc_027644 [Petrolisthes cinctipes]|uniref:Uncharacterized protein n=1 Tax=Petrolisthes cinctipes TaxID=88211 RepID=A0AAE1F4M2_PETCI|nr:hypothetical protein Pcinc_027644 [Petrolisthes cinctipes]